MPADATVRTTPDAIHELGHVLDDSLSRGRDLGIVIDGVPLVDLLEAASCRQSEGGYWSEKGDARVQTRELKRSIRHEGAFALLTCAHCKMPEDLSLQRFTVRHDGQFITWEVTPPRTGSQHHDLSPLRFRFARVQYETSVHAMMQRANPALQPPPQSRRG